MEIETTAEAPKPAAALKFWESVGPALSVLAPMEDPEELPAPLPPADGGGGSDIASVEEGDGSEASELPPLPPTPDDAGREAPPPPPPAHLHPAELDAVSPQHLDSYRLPGYHPDPYSLPIQGSPQYGLQPTQSGQSHSNGQLNPVVDPLPPWHSPKPAVQSFDVPYHHVAGGGQPNQAVASAVQGLQPLVPPSAWNVNPTPSDEWRNGGQAFGAGMELLGQAVNQVQSYT
jgi:hypothetical protein